jgi:hypothetical protein
MHEKCYLSKIGLVKVNINEETFQTLCKYLKKSTYIDTIDLSWNEIKPK